MKRQDGTRLVEEVMLSPVHDEVGTPTGFIAITREVRGRESAGR
jgi:hypothetical protein